MNNKKAMATMYFIGTVVTILSFFMILSFLSNASDIFTTESQDFTCRSVLQAKASAPISVAENINSVLTEKRLFKDINYHCGEDVIDKSDSETKEEIFSEVGNLMQKCWYRYGEGELDFMQSIGTQGNWCFTCEKINFNENIGENYPFFEFAEWTLEEDNTIEIDGENVVLGDYLQLKYSDIDSGSYEDLEDKIEEMRDDATEPALQILLYQMIYEKENMMDLASKKIDTTDTNYVVFRYDRLQLDNLDITGNVLKGMFLGILAEMAVETAVTGLVGGAIAIPKALYKSVTVPLRIVKIQDRVNDFYSLLNKFRKTTHAGKVLKLDSIVTVLKSGSRADIVKYADDIKKIDDFKDYGRGMDDIVKIMDDIKITNFDDLGDLQTWNSLASQQRAGIIAKMKELDKVNDKADVAKLTSQLDDVDVDLGNFDDIRKRIQAIDEGNPIIDQKTANSIVTHFKTTARAASGAAGGYAGYRYSDEYEQYVDLMTREQYYRLCGTQRFEN